MRVSLAAWALLPAFARIASAANSTYTNPILPGWHSDPSCVFVPELDDTFFCVSSTFLAFPGIPVYASNDLSDWKLASSVLTRSAQLPLLNKDYIGQQDGVFAVTLRYREGTFYAITALIGGNNTGVQIPLYTTKDPYDSAAWSDPKYIENPSGAIDPDIFWDDDGKVYMATAGIYLVSIDLASGAATAPVSIWNGTGGVYPEGPHIYKKDGDYYLLIAEGGTELGHSITIARSRNIYGPYESYSGNPILTNRGTDQYFQTVGHGDLFQDARGNWWGVALSTRSGPEWDIYPMGRETVLYAATWRQEDWPILQPVRGRMTGWQLPATTKNLPGSGPFVDDPDSYDFHPGSAIPPHFVYWRTPVPSSYVVSPPGHPNALQLTPSKSNLTGTASFTAADDITFISRRQTDTLFSFSVDLSFQPKLGGEEAGISVFLTQFQHIDLSIGIFGGLPIPQIRFRAEASGNPNATAPTPSIVDIPASWRGEALTLQVSTKNYVTYEFSAASSEDTKDVKVLGTASAQIVSGGTGPFTGTLLGAFATSNGGNGSSKAYFAKWRYEPIAQQIDFHEYVPPRN